MILVRHRPKVSLSSTIPTFEHTPEVKESIMYADMGEVSFKAA